MPDHQQCPRCQYNLEGTAPDDEGLTRCPECGRAWTVSDLRLEAMANRQRRETRRWAVVVLLPALISLGIMLWQYSQRPVADMDLHLEAVFLWTLPIPIALGLMWAMRKSGLWSRLFHWFCYVLLIVIGNYFVVLIVAIPLMIIDDVLGRT